MQSGINSYAVRDAKILYLNPFLCFGPMYNEFYCVYFRHDELLLHGGFYKEMWKQQLQHNTDKDNGALSSTSSTGSADDGAS